MVLHTTLGREESTEMRKMHCFSAALTAWFVLFLNGSVIAQTIWHVDADAAAGGDGLSWATAFDDLQLALAAIQAGDEVWVAEGTYTPTEPDGDKMISFSLAGMANVGVYGGFAGWETSRDERDWQANVAILSGDLNSDDDPVTGVIVGDNSYHVVDASETTTTVVLDGFTVKGGDADSYYYPEFDLGGGMYIDDGFLDINNCVFTHNNGEDGSGLAIIGGSPKLTNCNISGNFPARRGSGLYSLVADPILVGCTISDHLESGDGGGMYIEAGSPVLYRCTFRNNRTIATRSGDGGALFNDAGLPTIIECTFSENFAGWVGGAIMNHDFTVGEIRSCTFTDNSSDGAGGAVFTNDYDASVFSDCTFENNDSPLGGAIYISEQSALTVTRCTFTRNNADDYGGGIRAWRAMMSSISECVFTENTAGEDGGGISTSSGAPIITDCFFLRNVAGGNGGGADLYATDATMTNCTFVGNAALTGAGGALRVGAFDGPRFINCTLVDNSSALPGGAIWIDDNGNPNVPALHNSIVWGNSPDSIDGPIDVTYSDIEGGWPGVGNIIKDPFIADQYGRLSPASPCIDAGSNDLVPSDVLFDLDGNPRFLDDPGTPDTGFGSAPIVDMGAFEFRGDSAGCNIILTVSPTPLVAGQIAFFQVESATPNKPTYLAYSLRGLGSTFVNPLQITLDLRSPSQAGPMVMSDANGSAAWSLKIPDGMHGRFALLQAAQYERRSNVVVREIVEP
jgi:predicted outer membrane repeat protein